MFKYITKNYWDDGEWGDRMYNRRQADSCTITENIHFSEKTGLYNQYGQVLYKVKEKNPIGFCKQNIGRVA